MSRVSGANVGAGILRLLSGNINRSQLFMQLQLLRVEHFVPTALGYQSCEGLRRWLPFDLVLGNFRLSSLTGRLILRWTN
jgi:hypothetical protein